tara:strand:- start:256 stop:981 length:726 start_codon:yes stop_codon:yes gene_type:complete
MADKILGMGSYATRVRVNPPASYFFDEDTTDYLALGSHADWALGTGEFTIECFFRITSGSTPDDKLLIGQATTGGADATEWGLFLNSGRVEFRTQGGAPVSVQWSTAVSTATWYHALVSRDGSDDIRLFVDGDEKASQNSANNFSATTAINIGYNANDSKTPFDGNIDEIRISDVARETGNFTPTAEEYTSDANTLLLIHCNEKITSGTTGSGAVFTDSGDTGHTVTETNSAIRDEITLKF